MPMQGIACAEALQGQASTPRQMDNLRLQELIERVAGDVEGSRGRWQLNLAGSQTIVITDEKADRMRTSSRSRRSGQSMPNI